MSSQIIHYDTGTRLTIHNIDKVWMNTYLHITTKDGKEYIINQNRVLHSEIIKNATETI